MKVKVTRFAGVRGPKRRARPTNGNVSVTERGLSIVRHVEPRATWSDYLAAQPLKWQPDQEAIVYLNDEQRAELAMKLIESICSLQLRRGVCDVSLRAIDLAEGAAT